MMSPTVPHLSRHKADAAIYDVWIAGTAVPGSPYTDYWTPGGAILYQRPDNSIVELARFNLERFELDDGDC